MKITDPLGHITRFSYDANGNRTTIVDPNGHETKTEYNAANEQVKVTLPNGATRETGYDGAGQVTSQIDGNKHTTIYTRNVLEQITEITDPLLHKTTKTYDLAGNLASITDPAKRITSFTYNKDNQPSKITYSDGVTPTVEYEYDKDGNRTSMIDGSGKTIYTYDQLDRLTKAVDGHGNTVSYEYDLGNEQTKITYPNGKTVEHTYDKADRLASVKDWLSNTTSFGYDPNSNLTSVTFPAGTNEIDHAAYNEADQQTEAKMSKGTETLASLVYTRDSNGQVTKTVSKGLPGAETTETGYDPNERLSKAASTIYEYDAANNPTKIGSTTNTFNADSQLTEATGFKYAYDEEGERAKTTPTSGAATTYAYNQAGYLTSVTRPKEAKTAEVKDTYAYNGDGLRVSQTISGTTTYDTLDHTTPTPTVLNDGTNSYIYGPGGTQIEQISSSEKAQYLHHDQTSSTRLITGSTGTAEGAYTYTSYGAVESHTGTATTPLGYDGQFTSTDTGLIYLRARVYDPTTAQFMSMDPAVSVTRAPYTYAEDNPLTYSDPTGLGEWEPWTESFWTEGNFISKSSLNPIPYYEKEIESYENGCGYFASVTHGIEGAIVGTASLVPIDDADLRVAAWLQSKFPWLSRQVTDWIARDNVTKYGQPGWQELIKKAVEHIIPTDRASMRGEYSRQVSDIVNALAVAPPSSKRWLKLMMELQRVSPPVGMETLRASLCSRDRRECAGAQQVLISLGTEPAFAALADSLQTADNVAVGNAARLLGGRRARSAIPALIRCLDTRSGELDGTAKRWLARSLGLMPHRDEIPVLAGLLREPSRRTRTTAAWALAQIRSPESQAALESAANELPWFRGRAVRRALETVRKGSAEQ